MAETARLKLPLLEAAQAQKHVTHNEALAMLDLLTGVIPVLDRSLSAPPGAGDGAVYILSGSGTGSWSGFAEDDLALCIDGGWRRVVPSTGMVAAIVDESGQLLFYDGSAWSDLLGGAPPPGPCFSAELNYDLYCAPNVWVKVAYNNDHHNDQNAFVAASNLFVAPADGYYQLGGNFTFKANSVLPTSVRLGLAVDGTLLPRTVTGAASPVSLVTTLASSAVLKLTATQTVEVQARMAGNDGYVEAASNSFWGLSL